MVFDDVLIPWERVFLMRDTHKANTLFRSRVMAWAGYASVLQLLARLELIIGVGHLMAETAGMSTRPNIILEMGELVSYKKMFESIIRAAEIDCDHTPGGHYALSNVPHLRSLIAHTSERIVQIIEHIGTSSLIFTAMSNDLKVPELKPILERYCAGKDTDAYVRQKICKLAWELTGDSFGGRQQLYERLHSGSPDMLMGNVYRQYDKSNAISMVKELLDLNDKF
jgi:aromatic ring hydroxylase